MSAEREYGEATRAALSAAGYDIVMLKTGGQRQLRAVIDHDPPAPVTTRDLEVASRAIVAALEELGYDPGSFDIRVESPGVDRLLTRPKDFLRFLGSELKVSLDKKRDGRKRYRGRLQSFADGALVLMVEGAGEVRLPLEWVAEARIVPSF